MSQDKRTYSSRPDYLKKAVSKRRKKIKVLAVQYKGGQCQFCGYKRDITALEFHHINSRHKSFALSASGLTRGWERVRSELDKCLLVCANCHRETHSGLLQLAEEIQ